MRYKLKEKEVIAITWNDKISQETTIKELEEIGCYDIKISNSGAGIGIDFCYKTPTEYKSIYYGCIFYGVIMVFSEEGKYPKMYSSKDFNELYESIIEEEIKEPLSIEEISKTLATEPDFLEHFSTTLFKDEAIAFNRWLFDNNFVPNSSFLWFNHTLSHLDVKFFTLEELYNIFKNK